MCSANDDPTTYTTGGYTVATFDEALRDMWGEDYDETLREVAEHGCDGGVPNLTYYSETGPLYRAHADEIWDALAEDAEDMGLAHPLALLATFGGAGNVSSDTQLSNLLVWYMAERIANAR